MYLVWLVETLGECKSKIYKLDIRVWLIWTFAHHNRQMMYIREPGIYSRLASKW